MVDPGWEWECICGVAVTKETIGKSRSPTKEIVCFFTCFYSTVNISHGTQDQLVVTTCMKCK